MGDAVVTDLFSRKLVGKESGPVLPATDELPESEALPVTEAAAEMDVPSETEATGATAPVDEPELHAPERSSKRGSGFERVSNVSMHALARRSMSSEEMRAYLRGREFEDAEVEEEVDRLETVHLLDDHDLAETLVRTLQDRKGLGRSALTSEMRRRRLDSVAIEEALGGLDDDDELQRAIGIAVKRAGQLRSLDSTTAKRRLGDFLMRRGYHGTVVSRAVSQALGGDGSESRGVPTFR